MVVVRGPKRSHSGANSGPTGRPFEGASRHRRAKPIQRRGRWEPVLSDEQLVYDGLQSCPYLDGRVARMPLYRQNRRLTPEQADVRLANAERRVGFSLYRTECPTCTECKGIRVLVGEFRPSKSQRRVARRWEALGDRLVIQTGRPTWSDEKLDLFNRHKFERGLAESDAEPMDAYGYAGWLLHSCTPTIEMTYHLDGALIGVGILDLGATSSSSVYFYFDPSPEISRLSPGVFSVLQEIAFCARTGRTHHYLGLWVRDCPSLSYKSAYYPHERLEDGDWRRYDSKSPAEAQSGAIKGG